MNRQDTETEIVNFYKIQDLKHYTDSIKELGSLTLDLAGAENISDENLEIFGINLLALKDITSFDLLLSGCKKITDLGLSKLSTALAELPNLKHLSINLDDCIQITSKGITMPKEEKPNNCLGWRDKDTVLAGSISTLKELTNFSLSLRNNYMIDDAGFTGLANAIGSLKSLTKLHIDISECKGITNVGAIELFTAIGRLSKLRSLKLIMEGALDIKEEALWALNESLSKLKSLKYLTLNVNKNNYITNEVFSVSGKDPGIFGFVQCLWRNNRVENYGLGKTLLNMTSLKKIEFSGFNENVTDDGLYHFNDSLGQMIQLERVSLNLSTPWKVGDKCIKDLMETIGNLSGIKELGLNFSERKSLGDSQVTFLCSRIAAFKEMRALELKFRHCGKIGYKALIEIANTIGEMKGLRKLVLDLAHTSLADNGIVSLGGAFSSLKKIRHLELDFTNTQITDNGLKALGGGLCNLKRIEKASICLTQCKDITNAGFSYLAEGIVKFHECAELKLDFNSSKIEDESLHKLGASLAVLRNLKVLKIDISDTFAGDAGIIKLSDGIKKVKSIEQIELVMAGCDNITDRGLILLFDNFTLLDELAKFSVNVDNCKGVTTAGLENVSNTVLSYVGLAQFSLSISKTSVDPEAVASAEKELEKMMLPRMSITCL